MRQEITSPPFEHLCRKVEDGSSSSDFDSKIIQLNATPENCLIAHSLISCGRWVFLSNKIVSYWPFSQTSSLNYGHYKYLRFQLPTLSIFLSLLYIFLNIFYVVHYFSCKIGEDAELFEPFDLILITIWDLMVVVSVGAHRIYGMLKLSQFRLFWDEMVSVVALMTRLSSKKEIEGKFRLLRRWTFKWFVVFLVFGLVDCSAVIYHYTFVSEDNVLITILFEYLEIVICMHNSSALMLIFFIKIITHGFSICKQKVNELSINLPFEYEMVTVTCRHKLHDRHQNGSPNRHSGSLQLRQVLQLVHDLERCVSSFNKLFAFSLFLEAVLGFWQVLFSMYFLHITPIENFAFAINMAVPIVTYLACLLALCMAASQLTVECQELVADVQKLPLSAISREDAQKVQILVVRLASSPPAIQVSQLFVIRESLLGSALNALATYFIVLVQMRQIRKAI